MLKIFVVVALIALGAFMISKQTLSGNLLREVEGNNETILIGVISDTHIPTRARAIPPEVFMVFEDANYIIHAGDFVRLSVAEELQRIAPILGVQGNMDPSAVREKYPRVNSLEVLGWKIGVVHDGMPLLRSGRLRGLAKREGFDVLVSGHTHRGSVKEEDGILYVNPGSPTQPLFSKASVGILKISEARVEAKIVILE